jgi:hypothetical protein
MKLMVCYDDSAAGAALNLVSRRARALDAKIYVVTSIKGGADIPRPEFVRSPICHFGSPLSGAYGEMTRGVQPGGSVPTSK